MDKGLRSTQIQARWRAGCRWRAIRQDSQGWRWETGAGVVGGRRVLVWDEGAGQGWGVRLLDSGLPRLSLAASGQCRLWAPEEPPSTHLIFPGFQLQLLQAKEPLWSEGPLEPRRGDSFPPSLAHTPPFSLAPPSKGADPTLVGGPPDWEAGPAGIEVNKTWPPPAPTTVLLLPVCQNHEGTQWPPPRALWPVAAAVPGPMCLWPRPAVQR